MGLTEDRESVRLIEAMHVAGRTVAAVCRGPAAFSHTKAPDSSPLVKGRSVTGFANSEEAAIGLTHVVPFLVEDMLKENGGIYSKAAADAGIPKPAPLDLTRDPAVL